MSVLSLTALLASPTAWAGEWSPCPPDQTTNCGPDAALTGGDEVQCCRLVERELVPVGVAEVAALRMGSLWVMRTELTRGTYATILGGVGPRLWLIHPDPVAGVDRALLPATHLSWYDAVLFANALSKSQGLEPVYVVRGEQVRVNRRRSGWRLPTVVEWDLAAKTLGHPTNATERFREMRPVCASGEPEDRLCDMASNAWEWTFNREKPDEWDPYTDAEVRDCASYRDGPPSEPCALRASTRLDAVGFRLVRRAR